MTGFLLGPKATNAGYRLRNYETVESTNTEAMHAAAAEDSGRVWFAALQQTKGRGRRGRNWQSPYGNLAASVLVVPRGDPTLIATLGFVAGVALNSALRRLVPDARLMTALDGSDGAEDGVKSRVTLKWPNDVLVDGGKVAGILLETHNRPGQGQAVVIGFGVNVVAAPAHVPYPTVSLSSFDDRIDAQSVFQALAESWTEYFEEWSEGSGVKSILERWRKVAAGVGAEVAVRRNSDVIRGIFEAVDDAGRLIIRENDGQRRAITAGDVHLGTTASWER